MYTWFKTGAKVNNKKEGIRVGARIRLVIDVFKTNDPLEKI